LPLAGGDIIPSFPSLANESSNEEGCTVKLHYTYQSNDFPPYNIEYGTYDLKLDNISPHYPIDLSVSFVVDGAGGNEIRWKPNSEPDIAGYNIYIWIIKNNPYIFKPRITRITRIKIL
jgi:hypothetical protein